MTSINQICEKYNLVLVDTCSFLNYRRKYLHFQSTRTKLERSEAGNKTLNFWLQNIPNFLQIFCTSYVLGELDTSGEYKYAKSLKRFLTHTGGGKKGNNVLKLMRSKNMEKKNKKKLITLLQDQNRILTLNPKQQEDYESFLQTYSQNCKKHKLSETDQHILISALIISLYQPTCIISKDNGISQTWIEIIKRRKISRDDFNFYINIDFNKFQKIRKKRH